MGPFPLLHDRSTLLLVLWLVSLFHLDKGYIKANPIYQLRLTLLSSTSEATGRIDLTTAVQRHISKISGESSPFITYADIDPGFITVCENVTFTTDLVKGEGIEEYRAMTKAWSEACATELSEAATSVNRVAMVRQNVVNVQWNVTYVPDAILSLVWLGRRLPGVKVNFFNVLDKERIRSSFSWISFRAFLERILYTGVMLLPHAVILGTTELSFREADNFPELIEPLTVNDEVEKGYADGSRTYPAPRKWILTGSKEKINLVRSIDAGLLKNRKLATDLLQFLDARKPATVSLSDWNDLLVSRINTRGIPGMGQFDIDGLEAEQQKELLNVSNKVLGWATLVVLLFGVAFSTVAFDKLFMYQERQSIDSYQSVDDNSSQSDIL